MKKLIFFASVAISLFACNNAPKEEVKSTNSKIVLAENIRSEIYPDRDTMWTEDEWYRIYQYDKEKMFNTIVNAVMNGKLKAYDWYPDPHGKELSIKQVDRILVQWDSGVVIKDAVTGKDVKADIKIETTYDKLVKMHFNEKIEFDTITNKFHLTVNSVSLFVQKINEMGDVVGIKKLFDVKMNDNQK